MENRSNSRVNTYQNKKPKQYSSDEMVFGIQSVTEILRSGKDIDRLYLVKEGSFPEIQQLAFERRVTIQRVPVEKLDRITRKNHQGAICFVSSIYYAKLSNVIVGVYEKGNIPLLLVLDRITDVRNFGAIARTAECAGAQGIVIPARGAALINADAMKTSSGALSHLPVCREVNLEETIKYLKDSGIKVVACTEKTDHYLYDVDMSGPTAIIMGSEDDGISDELLRLADHHARIPLVGQVESLNVSVATGVVLYEAVRQRIFSDNEPPIDEGF
ncbi:23S rRNA (guanosine(2251)-2'-O)-methyltransferase RlmB [Larkinella terrae]|uniref:23S rRNA (Guanosine(2251)-2'-O)-methyltransferase RlmB n=1 Tax=Larkinella terrae TaxID=2025311 RepID=A0A7K0EU40_9BACT|nr:23S rRNA (guanosine(2251)-2'-O)-methyltransferase RlmB [Larkinella terrae]MRS64948.1 23S rRNA (guanosine(2251)-2'-O)-methyltransferase RlmB [Larkinella terrae]